MIFGLLFMLAAVVLFLWGMIRPFKSKKTDSFVSRKKIAAYSIGLFFGGAILTAILVPKLSPEQRAAIAARKAEENRVEAAEKEANAKKDAEQKAVEVVVQPVKPSVEPSVNLASMAKFSAIKNGMKAADVYAIMGGEGEVISESEVANIRTSMHVWQEDRGFGNMNVMFQRGVVIAKAQFGLK